MPKMEWDSSGDPSEESLHREPELPEHSRAQRKGGAAPIGRAQAKETGGPSGPSFVSCGSETRDLPGAGAGQGERPAVEEQATETIFGESSDEKGSPTFDIPSLTTLPDFTGVDAEAVDEKSFIQSLRQKLPANVVEYLQTEAFASKIHIEALLEARRLLSGDEILKLVSDFFRVPLAPHMKPDRDVLKKSILMFMVNNILPLSPTEFVIAAPREAILLSRIIAKEGFTRPRFYLAKRNAIAKALRTAIISLREPARVLQDKVNDFLEKGRGAAAVNYLIAYAYRLYASDLHFEHEGKHGRIRARVDGIMEDICPLSSTQYERVIVAVYQMTGSAQPNLKESGDGAFSVDGLPIQVRVSLIPSLEGHHHVVMRLLPKETNVPSGEDLGYASKTWGNILASVKRASSGLILLVGPTGAGKNSTLFSMLSSLDTHGKKLIEVADPIEYKHMFGIQAQLADSEKVSWSYPDALRAALRHDPDMIFVGEIRDKESAKIALDAARTGHLIFSTVHAETPFEAYDRLSDLGCSVPYLLGATRLIIAQRLLRRVCVSCGGTGCQMCVGGYSGRFAVAEVLEMTENMREAFNGQLPVTQKKRYEVAKKVNPEYVTLREAAEAAVRDKMTTAAEIFRVLGVEITSQENLV